MAAQTKRVTPDLRPRKKLNRIPRCAPVGND